MTLAQRLRAALNASAGRTMLAGDDDELLTRGDMTAAAVLIAVTDRAEPGVILTQRTETLRKHPGQVAFPGGQLDPGEDAVAAALREAEEEVALPRTVPDVVATLEPYRTGTAFEIVPVIAVVPPDLPLVAAEAEVASVFEVPLRFLLDIANHAPRTAMWQGAERHYVEILWNDRRIWGATAGMIVNLSRRLSGL